MIQGSRQEAERELRRRERLEKESKDIKHLVENRAATLRTRNIQLAQSETNERRVNDALSRQKGATDRALRELELARARVVSPTPTPTPNPQPLNLTLTLPLILNP